jgi:alanine racemase
MSTVKDLKWIEVDLSAIAQNTRWVCSQLGEGAKLMAVVKADAYGHGAVEVSRVALKSGAVSLGVRDLAEAAQLRQSGIKAPIHVLFPIVPDEAPEAIRLGVSLTVDDLAQVRALNTSARGKTVAVHVDIDFGLGRWGVPPRNLQNLIWGLAQNSVIKLEGLSAHIDYVPGKNAVEAEEKLTALKKLSAPYKKKNPSLIVHAANSSVFMDFPHHRFDVACIGNLLYGINPSSNRPAQLKNAWRFCARILSLRDVRKGASIGYASEYVAPKRMKIATVPVGYCDGLTMEPAGRLIGFGGINIFQTLN